MAASVGAAEHRPVRVGLLKFGTVAWELDTIRHHGLDRRHGLAVVPVEFATNEAAKVALQAGAVDLIVTDWPWVARQRAEGADFSFVPYSKSVGTLLVRPGSGLETLAALKAKRIGVAGGPLDKSWVLLRALARKELGVDLADAAEPVFGAPPLLAEEFARGRVDAVLTYWHYSARLEAAGAKPLLGVAEMIRRLGIEAEVPMLGFAFRESWAARHGEALSGFVAASRDAKSLMRESPEEWTRLSPQIGTADAATLSALRAGYSAGIPQRWGEAERRASADLHAILVEIGGETLMGRSRSLEGTFWPGVAY
ncbi:MAG TPA: ABC transporter substrate-binding protein [Microvirga sp.]|nr:ABC transporter substrate-binding protein [Microvirga sp.]